jgi:predicted acetyltransferase
MSTHFNTKMVETAGVPAVARKPQGNHRIMRARGFHRAWLIADHLRRFEDGAGIILSEALLHLWLSKQRRWA